MSFFSAKIWYTPRVPVMSSTLGKSLILVKTPPFQLVDSDILKSRIGKILSRLIVALNRFHTTMRTKLLEKKNLKKVVQWTRF